MSPPKYNDHTVLLSEVFINLQYTRYCTLEPTGFLLRHKRKAKPLQKYNDIILLSEVFINLQCTSYCTLEPTGFLLVSEHKAKRLHLTLIRERENLSSRYIQEAGKSVLYDQPTHVNWQTAVSWLIVNRLTADMLFGHKVYFCPRSMQVTFYKPTSTLYNSSLCLDCWHSSEMKSSHILY